MYRRPLLVGALAVLAGCTTREADTEETTSEFLDAFRNYLDSVDVTVVSLEETDKQVRIEYVPRSPEYEELSAEIGAISGGFLREVEKGWDVTRLDARIVSESDQPLASWHVESAWVEEYRENEISGEDLSLKIINTLEYE